MICEALEKATKIFERSSTATRQLPTESANYVVANNTAVDLDVGPSVTTSIFEDGRPLTLVADDSLNDDTGITNLGDAFQTVSLDHYRKEAQEALERVKALEKRKPSDSAMDKFKSWFSFKRPATLARFGRLSQFRKKIFTSKLLRVGLRTTLIAMLPAMTPLILSPDNHSANNKEWARNLKVNSVKRDTITQEQNEKNNNEFLSAGKKALELIEKDANRIPSAQSPSIKLRLSNNPKLNIDYTVDMENTTRVQIPEGSNVWRLVVADLEKKVSDFKDMDKPYKDTLVANIIKAMSAVYKSTSSNNPNNNLSMVRVGEYINIPTIKI